MVIVVKGSPLPKATPLRLQVLDDPGAAVPGTADVPQHSDFDAVKAHVRPAERQRL
jgi:hypothetical protein